MRSSKIRVGDTVNYTKNTDFGGFSRQTGY